MTVILNFWTTTISQDQAEDILSSVLTAITTVVEDPMQEVKDVSLFSARNQKQIGSWNPPLEQFEDACLHHVIEQQASDFPEAQAVCSNDGNLTYSELNSMANALASHLISIGVHPESIVPFCFEKSMFAVVATLAVLKAGGACAALDPHYPSQRLRKVIDDCKAKVILSSSSEAEKLKLLGLHVVTVDAALFDTIQPSENTLVSTVQPSNAAFVVFTSGSTGIPKGAIIEHRSLYAMSRMHPRLQMHNSSRVLQFASYTFDVSIEEIFITLMYGACICIISDQDRFEDLAGAMTRMKVNWTELTPTVVKLLDPTTVPYLRTLVLGGELVTDDVIKTWADKVNLYNTYGPCECSITVTLTDRLESQSNGNNIGRAFASRTWVVDSNNSNQLAPIGAIGELLIEGPAVGRGYLNDPVKTTTAFLTDIPWTEHFYPTIGRFYKTGDLVRYAVDGTLLYMGRKDNQTKIRGQRIDLGDIEHHIHLQPQIQNAVACVPQNGLLKQKLVALVLMKDAANAHGLEASLAPPTYQDESVNHHLASVQSELEQSLPRHMVPTVWITVRSIPLSAAGKINRRLVNQFLEKLSVEDLKKIMSVTSQRAKLLPSTDMESFLHNMWAHLLGIPAQAIGVDQSFFNLGGDSVLAMQVISRCRAEGITLAIYDLFRHKSIKEITPHCTIKKSETRVAGSSARPSIHIPEIHGINASNIENSYPCSPMQESILNAQQDAPGAWYAKWVMEVIPKKDSIIYIDKLLAGWRQVVQRHSILRTVFYTPNNNGPRQQIVLKQFNAATIHITSNIEDPAKVFEGYQDSVPALEGPHHQLKIVSTSKGKVYCLLEMSHTLYDAVSISIIWRDLQLAYSGNLLSNPVSPYSSFIEYIGGKDKIQALQYWRDSLQGAELHLFPTLAHNTIDQSREFKGCRVLLDQSTSIHTFCKSNGITLANFFQVVWSLVLRAYTSSNNISFGFMLSGRDAQILNVDTTPGPFINLLPYHTVLSDQKVLKQVLLAAQETTIDILSNQQCSLEEILNSVGKRRLYNTFLNMQRVAGQSSYEESSIQFEEKIGYMTDEVSCSNSSYQLLLIIAV